MTVSEKHIGLRIVGPRPVERNGLRGFVTTFHFGNTHSAIAGGPEGRKQLQVHREPINAAEPDAATCENSGYPKRRQEKERIAATYSRSPDSSHQVNSPASSSSPEPGTPFQAKASEDNGATGSDREVPTDCMTGEVSRVDAGRTASATSENGRDSVERHAPHSHASRNGEG